MWSMMYGICRPRIGSHYHCCGDLLRTRGDAGDSVIRLCDPTGLPSGRDAGSTLPTPRRAFRYRAEPWRRIPVSHATRSMASPGATVTANGVTNLIHYWFGMHGYQPFLEKLKNQPADPAAGDGYMNIREVLYPPLLKENPVTSARARDLRRARNHELFNLVAHHEPGHDQRAGNFPTPPSALSATICRAACESSCR